MNDKIRRIIEYPHPLLKVAFWLFSIAMIILFLYGILFLVNNKINNDAIAKAEEHLRQTYEQEMVMEDFFRDIVELRIILTFSKKANPDFTFKVYLHKNKETSKYEVGGDNYIEELVLYGVEERYTPIAQQIWGDYVDVAAITTGRFGRDFAYLSEYSTIEDIEGDGLNKNFILFIDIPYYFGLEERESVAEKIYEQILLIQKEEIRPKELAVTRLTSRGEMPADQLNSEFYWIRDIDSIKSIEQVYDLMDKYWFLEEEMSEEIN